MFHDPQSEWQKRTNTQQINASLQVWPQVLDSEHVTRLLLLQQLSRLGLVDYSPLDDPEFVAAVGGEGVEAPGSGDRPTGHNPQKNFSAPNDTGNTHKHTNKHAFDTESREAVVNGKSEWGDPAGTAVRWRAVWAGYNPSGSELLKKLKELEIYRIEVRVLDRFERAVLTKVAQVMEVDRVARAKFKRDWIKKERKRRRQNRAVKSYEIRKRERERVLAEVAESMKKKQVIVPSAVEELPVIEGDPPSGNNDEASLPDAMEVEDARPERVERSMAGVGEPVEVEMEVVRVGPNPRVLLCRYRVGDAVLTTNVWVKTNKNFKRSMRFRMKEEEGKDWKYVGPLPRHLGRW